MVEIDNKILLEYSKNLTVLYVEDDAAFRESTSTLLSNFFAKIDTAEDGEIGFSKYQQKYDNQTPYDLVISDIAMPNLNGIEMSEKIKSFNYEQAIILVTAHNELEYLSRAINIGVSGFLTKPIEIKSLKNVLYSVAKTVSDRKFVQTHYDQIEAQNMAFIDKKDASEFESSKNILVDLENNKEKISHLWTQKEIVKEKMKLHHIDVEFFRTHYAIKVIEYFLGVIKGENEAGNCPVVFVMLDFFKNKDLPLNDIFMICVTFKNEISSYIFSKYSFNQLLYDDISKILDKNFEGVIVNYLKRKYVIAESKKEKVTEKKVEKTQNESIAIEENINYSEYVLEHDIYELQDLEEDIDTLAILVTENKNSKFEDYLNLGEKIKRYGDILNNYPIFSDLGKTIQNLGLEFSTNAKVLYEDKDRMRNIAALIEGFVNDLIVWRVEIFENNISDPHFLNQSIFSNVDTIIMYIGYDESSEKEEEFDDIFF